MCPNATISDSLSEKWKFLDKYDKVSKFIKPNTACYAIATDWWVNFECLATLASTESDMLMGNPGPINNLPLLNLSKMYTDLVHSKEEGGRSDSIPHQVLTDMNDWDNMSLKPELRYRDDFVIVSQGMWKFLLEQFGGGPEIEFIPESKPTNPSKIPKNAITYQDEPYLNDDLVINLDMIKVYVTKGHNFECAMPRYISPSITVHNLLSRLSNPNFFHASLYLKSKQNDLVELESNLEGLADKGVQQGSFLMYTEDTDSKNKDKEGEIASSKDYPYGGKQVTYDDYDALDYANTYNDYPNQGDVEMKDFKNEGKNGHQNNESDKNNARLEVYRHLSKQAADKEKFKLEFKDMNEIKNNLLNIQEEWNLESK